MKPAKKYLSGKGYMVEGHELEVGDLLMAEDVYASSSGDWAPCPCPGVVLREGFGVQWIRPAVFVK